MSIFGHKNCSSTSVLGSTWKCQILNICFDFFQGYKAYLVCEKLHPHDYGERPKFLEKDSGTY